jgi:hypothetical protein
LYLSLEIVIFTIFYYFFSDLNKYTEKQLIWISLILAMVNFKVYSSFWLVLYFVRLDSNKKRMKFAFASIFFNFILNVWIFLIPKYQTIAFWLDLSSNSQLSYFYIEELGKLHPIVKMIITLFRQRMLFTIPIYLLLCYATKRLIQLTIMLISYFYQFQLQFNFTHQISVFLKRFKKVKNHVK